MTITRTSITGRTLTYRVLARRMIGTAVYAECLTETGSTVLLPL